MTEGIIAGMAMAILDKFSQYMRNETKALQLETLKQEETLTHETMAVVMASEGMVKTYNGLIEASEMYASAIIGYADMLKRKMGMGSRS